MLAAKPRGNGEFQRGRPPGPGQIELGAHSLNGQSSGGDSQYGRRSRCASTAYMPIGQTPRDQRRRACGTVQMARAAPVSLASRSFNKPLAYAATETTMENSVSWSEAMKGNTTVALPVTSPMGRVPRSTQTVSWDPFEVWLTRIKQPRDRAAKPAAADTPNGIGDRRDSLKDAGQGPLF